MEVGEIDDWYEEKKQEFFSRYLEELSKVGDEGERKRLEQEYKEKMRQLREEYLALYEKGKKKGILSRIFLNIRNIFGAIGKLRR